MEVLDLPKYLNQHGNKIENVKMVCVLDRQVKLPQYLESISRNNTNIPCLVDVVGVDIGGYKYLVKGKVLVVVGPRSFEPTQFGKRVLLLSGNFISRSISLNYVEMTLIYKTGMAETLYATKTLYRELSQIRKAYPEFANAIDIIARDNWNYDNYFNNIGLSPEYRVCCSDTTFQEIGDNERFVYKSDEEYQRSIFDNTRPAVEVSDERVERPVLVDKELESRKNMLERPKNYKVFENVYNNLNSIIKDNLKKLSSLSSVLVDFNYMDYLYGSLKHNWNRAPSMESATGRALFKNTIEHLYPEFKIKYENGKPFIDEAIDNHHLLEIWYTGDIPEELKNNYFYFLIGTLKEGLYVGVIDYLLSCKNALFDSYTYSLGLDDVNFIAVLRQNPYYLSLIDNRLNIETLDKLAMLFNVNMKDEETLKFRNAAYLHNYMLNPSNIGVEENTIVVKSNIIKNIYSGYQISSRSYKYLQSNGYIVSNKIVENLHHYIDNKINYNNFELPKDGWKEKRIRGVSCYVLNLDVGVSRNVLEDYKESGLGSEFNLNNKDYLMDYTNLYKELFIMNKLYKLQEIGEKPIFKEEDIDRCIRGFERIKGLEWNMPDFKLEEKQKEAVKLLYNPILCVTGPAGSGKTTTAEALLFGLQALLGIEENQIVFCAPTGKAASRLKEIVKKPTRTINSLFTIGNESFTLLKEDTKKKSEIKVLIVDECSMINLNLMFNMLNKISDGTRIIFLGDKAQLPPIGSGKPFADFLSYLPCVVLNVLKRASENSGISKNAQNILYLSDKLSPPELQNYDDFRILEVPRSKIADLVVGIVNYHMGRAGEKRVGNTTAARRVLQSLDVDLSADDIQVLTPVKKYEWGSKNLNIRLQDVINPKNENRESIRFESDFEIVYDEMGRGTHKSIYTELRVNDRVIHLNNMADRERFLQRGKNIFEKISDSSGVMNGEIGKVVGFIKANELSFVLEDGSPDEEIQNLFANNDSVIYTAVAYQDVTEKGEDLEYIILYKGDIIQSVENEEVYRNEKIYTLDVLELKNLDLAYALTVHKFQGSQAKLIIFVLYPVGYETFISKNMIYTGISRAEKGEYLVGNVTGWNNVISSGRKIEQNVLRLTMSDCIYG